MPHFPIFNTTKDVLSQSFKKRSGTNSAGRITKLQCLCKKWLHIWILLTRAEYTRTCVQRSFNGNTGKGKI